MIVVLVVAIEIGITIWYFHIASAGELSNEHPQNTRRL
jgi:hypothetical protein